MWWKWAGAIVLAFILTIGIILPAYLGPDDLRGCEKKPTNSSLKEQCTTADAIVAVSGGDTPARAAEAIKLYQNGWAPMIVFSGAAQDSSGPSNAQAMQRQALDAGIDESAIIIEEDSRTTAENAEKTQDLLKKHSIKKAILTTSAYHQRRASLEFQKRAGSDLKIINHPVATDKQWSQYWWTTPSGWWLSLGELSKIIVFYAGGSH